MTTTIKSSADGTYGALQVNGDDAVTFDSGGIRAGSYKVGSINSNDFADGALIENAPVGLGYGTGAGGTVTQATSKSTAVTLNKPCGQITMHNASLAAGASALFAVVNTLVSANDTVNVNATGGVVDFAKYRVEIYRIQAGAAYLRVTNVSAGALAEPLELSFTLTKGEAA